MKAMQLIGNLSKSGMAMWLYQKNMAKKRKWRNGSIEMKAKYHVA
jgi:hypothetical protein